MQRFRTVEEFISSLDDVTRDLVEELRATVTAQADVDEHLKWNAPSYVHDGVDRLTFNVGDRHGAVRLVLHMGTARPEDRGAPPVMDDPSGLLRWSSDIRGVLTFRDVQEARAARPEVAALVARWLAIEV